MTPSEPLEQRTQPPVFFRAPENIQLDGEAMCTGCGFPIFPGEVIAEVDGDGMQFIHADCAEDGE